MSIIFKYRWGLVEYLVSDRSLGGREDCIVGGEEDSIIGGRDDDIAVDG